MHSDTNMQLSWYARSSAFFLCITQSWLMIFFLPLFRAYLVQAEDVSQYYFICQGIAYLLLHQYEYHRIRPSIKCLDWRTVWYDRHGITGPFRRLIHQCFSHIQLPCMTVCVSWSWDMSATRIEVSLSVWVIQHVPIIKTDQANMGDLRRLMIFA